MPIINGISCSLLVTVWMFFPLPWRHSIILNQRMQTCNISPSHAHRFPASRNKRPKGGIRLGLLWPLVKREGGHRVLSLWPPSWTDLLSEVERNVTVLPESHTYQSAWAINHTAGRRCLKWRVILENTVHKNTFTESHHTKRNPFISPSTAVITAVLWRNIITLNKTVQYHKMLICEHTWFSRKSCPVY